MKRLGNAVTDDFGLKSKALNRKRALRNAAKPAKEIGEGALLIFCPGTPASRVDA
jgi:hypothetical protein